MNKLIRKTLQDSICEFLIDSGKTVCDLTNPYSACKLGLELIEERNRNRFINEVLNGTKEVDVESLDAVKSISRLYKTLQVISKATTQDKKERFKQITINGIIEQKEIKDEDY